MRLVPILCAVTVLTSVPAIVVAGQDHHGSKAATVMGFDQQRTAHHFFLFNDGGAIDVSVKEAGDTANREAIQSHLPHIAAMFGSGISMHRCSFMTRQMCPARRRWRLARPRFAMSTETANGGRVNIFTSNRETLDAVHEFLKFQIAEHKTGDFHHRMDSVKGAPMGPRDVARAAGVSMTRSGITSERACCPKSHARRLGIVDTRPPWSSECCSSSGHSSWVLSTRSAASLKCVMTEVARRVEAFATWWESALRN